MGQHKIVIAHRGASGYLPEHTLESKAMAYAQGADYLEQDVVMTKDDQLVILHDKFLDRVTNVSEAFPLKSREDGRFYAIDFTLEEIRTLKFTEGFEIKNGVRTQLFGGRFPMWKSNFRIHTLEEEIEFIQGLNYSTGKNVGLYTEIKSPWFHLREGKDISSKTLEVLKQYGYGSKSDKVFIQIFDFNELKRIKTKLMPQMGMDLKMIMLIAYTNWLETYEQNSDGTWVNYSYDWMFTENGIEEIAKYAYGIGPDYRMVIDDLSQKDNIISTGMANYAHKNNLVVHPYTARADELPGYVSNINELFDLLFFHIGVDGLFTDFPDKCIKFLRKRTYKKVTVAG